MSNTKLKHSIKNKLRDEKYKTIYKDIFILLKNDDNFKYTSNNNGIFFDINKLNDDTITNLNNLLNTVKDDEPTEKLKFKSYYAEKYEN